MDTIQTREILRRMEIYREMRIQDKDSAPHLKPEFLALHDAIESLDLTFDWKLNGKNKISLLEMFPNMNP